MLHVGVTDTEAEPLDSPTKPIRSVVSAVVVRYLQLSVSAVLHIFTVSHECAKIAEVLYKCPPHLHLTTSKVMVIVWRLRGNIIRTVLYIVNVLPLQWTQLTKTVHTARLGLEFVFLCCLGCMICLYVGVCFVLPWTVESIPFMFFGAGVTNLRGLINK